MEERSRSGRRILLTILVVFVLAIVVGVAEVLRRYFEREELTAIHQVLDRARQSNAPLIEIDPDWDRLSESLRARVDAEPQGALAILAHRAVMRVSSNMHGAIKLADQSTATVRFGNLIERDVPIPDQPYVWFILVDGSWNNGPWIEWYRGSWTGDDWSEAEIVLDTGLSDADRQKASAFLRLRATLKLFFKDKSQAALQASGPDEFARVPFIFQERRTLGNFKILTGGVQTGSRGP